MPWKNNDLKNLTGIAAGSAADPGPDPESKKVTMPEPDPKGIFSNDGTSTIKSCKKNTSKSKK